MNELEYQRRLAEKIHEVAVGKSSCEAMMDEVELLSQMGDAWSHKQSEAVRALATKLIREHGTTEKLLKVIRATLKYDALVSFDCFMRFMEWERDPDKKFYAPRRKIIKSLWVDHIQDLLDDKLDLLTLSCPPGTGKSTMGMFLLSYYMGKNPDSPNLASAHSGTLTESFYEGILSFLTDPEYTYSEVFPVPLVKKNAMLQTIDLGKEHRFSTLTCRAINATLTGATRCEGLLYADDMCSGIEEAMNPERLDNLWMKYTNDLRSRKKQGCKEIHIATRWSVRDVIGRLENRYSDDPRARFISCPALNENDESNFDYEYNVGFDTKYFIDMRSNLDDVSWRALFMNEPIEREGLLFRKDELRYYYELPKDENGETLEPDNIIAIADTKDKGSDYGVMPVGYKYGNDIYIEDVVFNNGTPEIVEGQFIEMLLKHRVKMCRFESNAAGGKVADTVDAEVKRRGGNTHITRKTSLAQKETRIQVNSPMVKNRFLFKSNFDRATQYGAFMTYLTNYVLSGRNKHDDAPDAMAMLANFIESMSASIVKLAYRPW